MDSVELDRRVRERMVLDPYYDELVKAALVGELSSQSEDTVWTESDGFQSLAERCHAIARAMMLERGKRRAIR